MLLQRNISAPCTVLDFPTRERFVRELESETYDVVGLTGIITNVGKIREMCRLVRAHSPESTIVVSGHVTAIPGIDSMIDADHIVKGESDDGRGAGRRAGAGRAGQPDPGHLMPTGLSAWRSAGATRRRCLGWLAWAPYPIQRGSGRTSLKST